MRKAEGDMGQYLAIDIGGTAVKYSIMDEEYREYLQESQPTRKHPEEFLQQIKRIVDEYRNGVEGIAVCIGGFIDPATGTNTDFSVGENFRTYNLKVELEKYSNLPVLIENDSNCAALGEMVKGGAVGIKDFCIITIGTGIGAAIVVNGQLMRGNHFKAGEVGFMNLDKGKSRAGAASVLVQKVSRLEGKPVHGYYVFEHLDKREIQDIYQEWIDNLAIVVGNMAVTVDPQVILIGGGISGQPRFLSDLRGSVYQKYERLEQYTEIRACATGNQAGKIGALYLFLNSCGRQIYE